MASAVASHQPPSLHRWWPALACVVAGAALFQLFGNNGRGYIDTSSLFYWWSYQWVVTGTETGHGPLILGLSCWLFWRNLSKPETGDRKPETLSPSEIRDPQSAIDPPNSIQPALIALIGGLALHALGFAAQQSRISIIALLVFVWGALRLAGGRRWGAAAAFPIAFLVFAIPISGLDSIGFWLRVWVVNASGFIARMAGIGVLQSGTQLVAPDGSYNYDVAAACSGIRSLTAMTALSLLAGYLNFHSNVRRAIVLALSLPLVYIGNVARIIAIIFAAQIGGPKWGDIAHEVMGYGIFVIVLGGVLLAISAMRRWWPEPPNCGSRISDFGLAQSAIRNPKSAIATSARVAFVVVVLASAEMAFLRHLTTLPARGEVGVMLAADGLNPVELPAFVGTEWIGRRAEVSAVEREILPADTGYSRKNYVALADPRRSVFLSIVLSGRDRTSIHRPELCLVGQGWTIADAAGHRFEYPARPNASFSAMLLRVQREIQTPRGKERVPQLVAYWFVGGDAIVSTHWQRLLRDGWQRVAQARADRWAYVLMQTDASDGEREALARMQQVLNSTLPAFQKPMAAP